MNQKEGFIFEKRIAAGGMAEVYRVLRKGPHGFEKRLALKRILPEYSNNPEFVDSLIQEARISVKLNHENIVQTFELAIDNGVYYILMEYVDGADLNKLLEYLSGQNRLIPTNLALELARQVAHGLEYAHNKLDEDGKPLKIVHRDISPQNIIVSTAGKAKITDFGIAKATVKTAKTIQGTLKGKLLYMSPEQAEGRDVDHRSDIFSLGTLLYALLTGKNLFEDGNDIRIINKVREADISGIDSLDLPDQVASILKKVLAKDPADRYQNCAELAADIGAYLNEFPSRPTESELGAYISDIAKNIEKTITADLPLFPDFELNRGPVLSAANPTIISRNPEYVGNRTHGHIIRNIAYAAIILLVLGVSITLVWRTLSTDGAVATPSPAPKDPIPANPSPSEATNKPADSKPVPIEYGRLEVFAKPWGYVTISGIVKNKTTPFISDKTKPGKYTISVFYEPDDKTVTTEASVSKNKRTFCTVDFMIQEPQISCR